MISVPLKMWLEIGWASQGLHNFGRAKENYKVLIIFKIGEPTRHKTKCGEDHMLVHRHWLESVKSWTM